MNSLFEANIYRNSNPNEVWFKVIVEAFDDGFEIYQKLDSIVELLNATYGQVKWLRKVKENKTK